MKLWEVATDHSSEDTVTPALASMVAKLVAAGKAIFVSARSRTFLTGKMGDLKPYRPDPSTGWLIVHSKSPTDIERSISRGSASISSIKEYALTGSGHTMHSQQFDFEQPVDKHYTIKKLDGTWTILDKTVSESQTDDYEHQEFMLKIALRRMLAAGLQSELIPARIGQPLGAPYILTPWAGFIIKTFYDTRGGESDGDAKQFFCAWFSHHGTRTSPILQFATIKDVIRDIMGDSAPENLKQQ